ncbi:uncharacterized protein PRCAT00002745001 [Priceomyces carsonii]|uniref:uncharacterized protein n=1 Tax=Priceomyces carsonii TaxID=28549 RepID=UPI002ED89A62|nr:unnamed protein product [Priceomyces carsonii]
MTDNRSYLDNSGSFFANVLSKNGRNEVQVYPINKKQDLDSLIIEEQVVKIELTPEDGITSSCWADLSNKQLRKRRRSDQSVTEKSDHTPTLIAATTNKELLIITPTNGKVIDRIPISRTLVFITSSLKNGVIWGIDDESKIVEIFVNEGKVKAKDFIPQESYKFLAPISNESMPNSKNQYLLLVSDYEVYLYDTSKSSKKSVVPILESTSKFKVLDVNPNSSIVYLATEDELLAYDVSKSVVVKKLPISNVHKISFISENTVIALNEDGIQIINDDLLSSTIKTNFHDSEDKIRFFDAFKSSDDFLTGIWYDVNEPNFTRISWSPSTRGVIKVPIDYKEKVTNASNVRTDTLSIEEPTKIENIESRELFSRLEDLLTQEPIGKPGIIELCSTNDEEVNIKEVVKLLVGLEQLIKELFGIISDEVASDPSKNKVLALWLKWILLIHGGFLARLPDGDETLRKLRGGLHEGLKLMPRLLSLQGRLQLLKSQAELRDGLENHTLLSPRIKTINHEDIPFVNGENDDFEDAEEYFENNGVAYDEDLDLE